VGLGIPLDSYPYPVAFLTDDSIESGSVIELKGFEIGLPPRSVAVLVSANFAHELCP
jgi:hypothetical protein